MWGLNHGFPRNISTPTTPTEIAPTKHSVHLKEQEVSDLRGVFTPMFCAMLLAAAVMMLRPLPYHSIYPFKFIHEWISPLDSFGSANIWCVCYIFPSHSIIGAIESCSAFYENTLEALLRCFSFPESFFSRLIWNPQKLWEGNNKFVQKNALSSHFAKQRRNGEWRHNRI